MLRDWTKSEKMDVLTADAERFFTRLIMKADDFGCFYADTRLLKADLFPLKLDKIREADLLRWMDECQKAGLIVLYDSGQKKYLQIVDFGQRKRSMNSKFPQPDDPPTLVSNLRADVGKAPPEVEIEEEEEKVNKKAPPVLKSAWNTKPSTAELILELPELSIGAVQQQFRFTKNIVATAEQILGLWGIFKTQQFTGEKFYQSPKEVFSHFINWCQKKELPAVSQSKQIDNNKTEDRLKQVYGK